MGDEGHVSIEGTLLMLDDATPHVAVPVQAMRDGKVIATTLSDERGQYQLTHLKQGRYQVRCQILGGYVYYGEDGTTIADESRAVFLQIKDELIRNNIDFRFASLKKGTWRNYNFLDGLASNNVMSIYRTLDGMLWFGTSNGVSRYDGKEFVNFTTEDGLVSNNVRSIHGDTDGTLWFSTHEGVSRYDARGMGDCPHFVNFTTEDGLANNRVFSIYGDPDGILWFGTDEGVSRYDGKRFVNFTMEDGLAGNTISAIHRDPDGILWFGTDKGISRYDGREFVSFTTEDGLVRNDIHAIYCDPDGILWFGTGNGVSRYDGKGFVNLTTEDGLVYSNVLSIHGDLDGTIWFGTGAWDIGEEGGGVSRYYGKGFVNFTTEDGLLHNTVTSIYGDPDGTIWFGTGTWMGGGGVSQYDRNGLANFTTKDGFAGEVVHSMYRDPDDAIWFGTKNGVSRCDGGGMGGLPRFTNFTTEDGLVHNFVVSMFRDRDDVMCFGTWGGGLSRYDGREFVNFTQENGLAHPAVWVIHQNSDGMLWLGTQDGISLYDGTGFVTFTENDVLAHANVCAIYCDPDGVLWFGTFSGIGIFAGIGVFRYDGQSFTNLTMEDGLLNNNIEGIFGSPDGVMFATANGVSCYDGKDMVNITSKDGLAFDGVHAICQSIDGIMWFGTLGGGVSGHDGVAWTSLDTRDGLEGDSIYSIEQDSDGFLWFGTENCTTRYRRITVPPKVRIVSVTTDQTYRDLSVIPAFTPGTRVTIEYSSIDFRTLPEKRQYRSRIKETDPDWRKPTKADSVDFIFDEPGTYTFEVQAIDRDLNYSEPATLILTVQPDPKLVAMQMELDDLRQEVRRKYDFSNIIGESAAIRQVHALMERAIDSGLTVLITGETGTGKELVARAIHHNSPRKDKPILSRNCGAMPRELLTSELFGHRKGAFTGANEDKMGLFEAASGGTVQLDEIGEMPLDAQIHLLRFLEEREVQRLGENITRHVDVRIIATTNRDLIKEVTADRFREDLYHRLSEFPIRIPPLRERSEDVPLLAEHFLKDMDKELDGFAQGVFDMLQSYSWPGNVRELRNVVRRADALAEEGKQIQTYHFPPEITQGESLVQDIISERIGYNESLKQFRRRLVEDALRECNGNRSEAARLLNMNRPNLVKMIKRLGIDL